MFLGGIGLVVSYVLQPVNTLAFLESVKSWLNQPLPIVGVTATAVLILHGIFLRKANMEKTQH